MKIGRAVSPASVAAGDCQRIASPAAAGNRPGCQTSVLRGIWRQPACWLVIDSGPRASSFVIVTASYQVIFDATAIRFPAWPVASLGLLVAAIGVGTGAYLRNRAVTSTLARTAVTSAIIFGVSWALLVGGGLYAQHGQLRRALEDGSATRIEVEQK